MVQVTKQDYQMRASFLQVQIVEADKKLDKARKHLRNSFQHKMKLLDMLNKLDTDI